MNIEINPQREAYFQARGRVVLNACPGSGKTTCIVHKISLLEKECRLDFGAHAGIACLSFTNVAKQEILEKYRKVNGYELRYPNHVGTIDGFINRFITLPFINLLNDNFCRPKIVDDLSTIDKLFQYRYKDKNQKWQDGFIKPLLKFKNSDGQLTCRSYPPSSICASYGERFTYTFDGKIPSSKKISASDFQDYGSVVFKYRLNKGIITSQDSACIALLLVNRHPQIAEWLSSRFPYIVIDEAQDNSEVQHAIFDALLNNGHNNLELIGDPYQALYEWRDAKPQLFLDKYNDAQWKGFPLTQNRRSVQRIIDCFSIIRSKEDEAVTSAGIDDLSIPVHVYKYNDANYSLIASHFEEACKMHGLRTYQIAVRGNAQKDRMLGITMEIDPWSSAYPLRLLKIRHHFEGKEIKIAINEFRKLVVEMRNPNADYDVIAGAHEESLNDITLNGQLYAFLHDFPDTSSSLEDWTSATIEALKNAFNINANDLFVFKKKMNGYKMSVLKKQVVASIFTFNASNKYGIPITTIHQVKGITVDALLIFFDYGAQGQSVSFGDFRGSQGFPNEKQRMIYVACSRPRQFLAMAFPDSIADAIFIARFGADTKIVNL